PMRNRPAGHQQSLMPSTSRPSPPREPAKESACAAGGPSTASKPFVPAPPGPPIISPAIRTSPARRPRPVRDIVRPLSASPRRRSARPRRLPPLAVVVRAGLRHADALDEAAQVGSARVGRADLGPAVDVGPVPPGAGRLIVPRQGHPHETPTEQPP